MFHSIHGRRTLAAISVLAAGLAAGACKGKHSQPAVKNEEPPPVAQTVSSFKMNDEAASTQLLKGFYVLENNAWRWTAGSFTVLLKPPAGAAVRGGTVSLAFTLPEIVITKLKKVTITASVGTTKLKPQTYTKSGPATYSADIPADLLAKDAVTLDFELDHSLPPGSVDMRELGVIATAVGIESK